MDCILSYHMNPLTCGVARFNRALADRLNLPMLPLLSEEARKFRRPLISLKLSEFEDEDVGRLEKIVEGWDERMQPRLFFHDYTATPVEADLLRRAQTVYTGNEALELELKPLHANVVRAWCPGHLFDAVPFPDDVDISVYTFGMAHKVRADYFYRLHDVLEASGKEYCVYISAAIHEGRSLDDSFTAAYEELKRIFGKRIYFLGFISDTGLYNYLRQCTYFAAFFSSGVRANNTSVNTAMQAGAVVLTNLDEHSPEEFRHMESCIDIRQCGGELPVDESVLSSIAKRGREVAAANGWGPLVELFQSCEPELDVPPQTPRQGPFS